MLTNGNTKWIALLLATGSLLSFSACSSHEHSDTTGAGNPYSGSSTDQNKGVSAGTETNQGGQQPGAAPSNAPSYSDQTGMNSHSGGISGKSGGLQH